MLPPEFGELKQLTEAYLCYNKFTVVPLFVKDMPNLQSFYMDSNDIKEVQCADWILSTEYLKNWGNLLYNIRHPNG